LRNSNRLLQSQTSIFLFDWDEDEIQDDIKFVMQEYFPEQFFRPPPIAEEQSSKNYSEFNFLPFMA
jgi:hypothetical protein